MIILEREREKKEEEEHSLYEEFSRPRLAETLSIFNLNRPFLKGKKDFLFFKEQETLFKVLDVAGGFGANLLGHQNPKILKLAKNALSKGRPSHLQGQERFWAGKCAEILSSLLTKEVHQGPWIIHFSNSGAESIEAAQKHCLLSHQKKILIYLNNLRKKTNNVLSRPLPSIEKFSSHYSSFFQEKITSWGQAALLIEKKNRQIFQMSPVFAAVEKSFHGKTLGALRLTHNLKYRSAFFLEDPSHSHSFFLSPYQDLTSIEKKFEEFNFQGIFLKYEEKTEEVFLDFSILNSVAGIFVEPIQGEGGIRILPQSFLAILKKISLEKQCLLVFDEIQCGLYRTGELTASQSQGITPDIYTFSKSLGGGVAKIAATCILQEKYEKDFSLLHTSTFSEDDFSCEVAFHVLEILKNPKVRLKIDLEGKKLKKELLNLQKKFPKIIKEVRGTGLFFGIEFFDNLKECLEFKGILDSHYFGYLLSSALLFHHFVRSLPSLSAPNTLRIAPSLFFGKTERKILCSSLFKLCEAIQNQNREYFLNSLGIIEKEKKEGLSLFPIVNVYRKTEAPLCVFLTHFIDMTHLKQVFPSHLIVKEKKLERAMKNSSSLLDFSCFHAQRLKNAKGEEVSLALLSLPLISYYFKEAMASSSMALNFVEKIQKALVWAREEGASTVGLGQFTSIISHNGLFLDSMGMNLTTGNAYTVALSVEAAVNFLNRQKKERAHACFIGAAGNIASVCWFLLSKNVSSLSLIHHSSWKNFEKGEKVLHSFLNYLETLSFEALSPFSVAFVLKKERIRKKEDSLVEFFSREVVKSVFLLTDKIENLDQADLVVAGANQSKAFLSPELFKSQCFILDIAVPASLSREQVRWLSYSRPSVEYCLGGIAKLPKEQSIETNLFPLKKGQAFACLSETLALAFSKQQKILQLGELTPWHVERALGWAKEAGFSLDTPKIEQSF